MMSQGRAGPGPDYNAGMKLQRPPFFPSPAPEGAGHPPAEVLGLLLGVRAALVLGEGVLLALAVLLLEARLPWWPVLALLGIHLVLLAWGYGLRRHALSWLETALQLATDAALLGGLVYFTGGYANPFIFLLLVPLILGSVFLPPRLAWSLAAWVGLIYTLLMAYYHPLVLAVAPEVAVDLHLRGMWLNFLLTAMVVAAFTGALAAALRRRDTALAHAREQRLRDEQLFALGLQAAAAAHDLATPLASVRLILDDLRQDYAGDDELSGPLASMTSQVQRVEVVLARLSQAARSRETPAGPPLPAGVWLERTLEHWGLLHPQALVLLDLGEGLPMVEDDPAMEAVVVTLLNNAQQAARARVRVSARGQGGFLRLEVADDGSGLGHKPAGWGVGLDLAQAALERLGGRLEILHSPSGGVLARADLPGWPGKAGEPRP